MEEKMNIFDVEIAGFTAKAAMQMAVKYMQSESVNTIEIVTLDMLMQGKDDPAWKEDTKEMDMVLPGEGEILEAAEITDRNLLKDVTNQTFLKMFLRYLQRNKRRVFLIAGSEKELLCLEKAMEKYHRGIAVVGRGILSSEGKSEEDIINDVNGAETDCIISALLSPVQEDFIIRNKSLLNARVWLGCGSMPAGNYHEKNTGGVRRFLMKKAFRYRVEKQKKES
ncbi:WecB/TagA/CpsF family glycosyltransferase [Muricomes intestini]|uniref:N-acetylglucosaminyldiphosphoundecaprenol N-acetyl-beta-D-mannosaminyltransferase n=2 Tax=Muricomes intestini TaxID=1796634 RepID=A0A4R3K3E1_9FIRM|nr:N-acetylglucosaminyldiphosphoundecaprenol N-acetyl-beta-D-mannosaminyltransferase [Muricomes intestini]HAX52342.1 teichoic acid biosynthesis protein [Lachnospiraceae bacterium]HCR84634.1 teichoic acid biosynthesis protein [Lachnospiraceae bacterium]